MSKNKKQTARRSKRNINMRKKTLRQKGGGCGCNKPSLFGGKRRIRRGTMRGGDALLGNSSVVNTVTNLGTTTGAYSGANTLFGVNNVNPAAYVHNIRTTPMA